MTAHCTAQPVVKTALSSDPTILTIPKQARDLMHNLPIVSLHSWARAGEFLAVTST